MDKKGLGIIPFPFAGKIIGIVLILVGLIFGGFLNNFQIPAGIALALAGIALILL